MKEVNLEGMITVKLVPRLSKTKSTNAQTTSKMGTQETKEVELDE